MDKKDKQEELKEPALEESFRDTIRGILGGNLQARIPMPSHSENMFGRYLDIEIIRPFASSNEPIVSLDDYRESKKYGNAENLEDEKFIISDCYSVTVGNDEYDVIEEHFTDWDGILRSVVYLKKVDEDGNIVRATADEYEEVLGLGEEAKVAFEAHNEALEIIMQFHGRAPNIKSPSYVELKPQIDKIRSLLKEIVEAPSEFIRLSNQHWWESPLS